MNEGNKRRTSAHLGQKMPKENIRLISSYSSKKGWEKTNVLSAVVVDSTSLLFHCAEERRTNILAFVKFQFSQNFLFLASYKNIEHQVLHIAAAHPDWQRRMTAEKDNPSLNRELISNDGLLLLV